MRNFLTDQVMAARSLQMSRSCWLPRTGILSLNSCCRYEAWQHFTGLMRSKGFWIIYDSVCCHFGSGVCIYCFPDLHVSCGPMEKHQLRSGKVKARDQKADYWLQIAWIVWLHTHTCTHAHTQTRYSSSLSGGLKRELSSNADLTYEKYVWEVVCFTGD